ncbi:MAG: DNA repair protein RecO [Clostridiales bacterium]|nr:DNA repair protein RecO [Clostridiales bacterium]
MNKIKTPGLVIRESAVRDSDSLLSILTPGGLISAIAFGARKTTGSKQSGTRLFCYSDFTIFEKQGNYTVDSAVSIDTFFGVSGSVLSLAAASYFAEVLGDAALHGDGDTELLRLALVSLFALSKGKKDISSVKAAFELRLCALCGYEPILETEGNRFSFIDGCIFQGDEEEESAEVTPGVLMAMRHIVSSDLKRLMAFEITGESRKRLIYICQRYLEIQFDKKYKTLAIYNSLNNE